MFHLLIVFYFYCMCFYVFIICIYQIKGQQSIIICIYDFLCLSRKNDITCSYTDYLIFFNACGHAHFFSPTIQQHFRATSILFTFKDQINFAKEFASGYLIGEVLQKYQLQDDFDQFSQSK